MRSALWSRFPGFTCGPGGGGRTAATRPHEKLTLLTPSAALENATNDKLKVPQRSLAEERTLPGVLIQLENVDKVVSKTAT